MKRLKLYCIGPLPPVIHGQSEAFEVFVRSAALREAFDIYIVDLNTVNFSLIKKIIYILYRYAAFMYNFLISPPDVVYISFGRGRYSFKRDGLFLKHIIEKHIPIIAHYHGGDIPLLLKELNEKEILKVRHMFSNYQRVIVLGKYFIDDLSGLVDTDKIRIVPNCFRMPDDLNLQQFDKINNRSGDLCVLYLSNVNPDKGFFEVLEGIAILKQKGLRIKFTFVGSFISDERYTKEELKARTDKILKELEIEDIVTIKGPLYGSLKWKEYIRADIFVLPTYYRCEGLPISIIEAMAGGCAIITTTHRGIRDLIEDGKEGYFVSPGSAQDIAEKIGSLCANPGKLLEMKKAAKNKAFAYYYEERHVKSIVGVINEVVSREQSI